MSEPEEPPADPHQVDPAQHRGDDVGILALAYRLARHRRDDDPAGPRRIDPKREKKR